MKKRWILLCIFALCITGCGKSTDSKVNTKNSVQQVMDEQTKDEKEDQSIVEENVSEENIAEENITDDTEVDYDLTQMSSDMVYATVYQMMTEPEKYEGMTFRMDGLYYAGADETAGTCYHYCIIKDAMACCAQGLEFVWGDGSHKYPDEYPAENTEIEVQGTFETYKEKDYDTIFCRLANADMRIKE